jgi:hypothetical protein
MPHPTRPSPPVVLQLLLSCCMTTPGGRYGRPTALPQADRGHPLLRWRSEHGLARASHGRHCHFDSN